MSTNTNQIYDQVIQHFEKNYPDRILKKTKQYAQYGLFVDQLQNRLHYEFVRQKNSVTCEFHFEHKEAPFLYTYLKKSLLAPLKQVLIDTHDLDEQRILCTPKWKTNNGCGRVQIKFQNPQETDINLIIETMNSLIQTTQTPLQEKWRQHFSPKSILPNKDTLWDWINKLRHSSIEDVCSPGTRNSTYKNISIDFINEMLKGTNSNLKKSTLISTWEKLQKNSIIDEVLEENKIIQMRAFGWGSLAGLVDNKPFPYKADSTTFHLRYIPVNLDLFDSVMAELGLRRQPNLDHTTAIYKPSDWVSETDDSEWAMHVTKADTGFTITVHNETTKQSIALEHETVKQFGKYDWSTPNANTLGVETEGRFYVSWPEKMLLQEFLKGQLEGIENINYDPKTPEIWWHIMVMDESTIPYNHSSISNHGLTGLQFSISKRNWSNIPINQTSTPAQIKEICKKEEKQIHPFIYFIRPGDICIRTPKQKLCTSKFSSKLPTNEDQIKSTGLVRLTTAWKKLEQIREEKGRIQKIVVQHTLGEVRISAQASTLMVLKQNKDGKSKEFTPGFSNTTSYPIVVYSDFIEQRAKVLDPTSRALLVYLKYNTPIEASPVDSEDENSEDTPMPSTEIVRQSDILSNSPTIQKLTLSKNLILEGVPGTGKTYAFNNQLVENWTTELKRERISKSITMHPSTSYEDFLEGLRPELETSQTKENITTPPDILVENLKLAKKDTILTMGEHKWFFNPPTKTKGNFTVADGFFLNVCKEAVQNPSQDFLVLLDEINRCNIPSVFGDLLTAIERSKRATWDNDNQCWNLDKAQTITLAISKRQFFVPENVYVVGTMNTTDRSVAPMDMALRRRFAFHRIEPVAPEQSDFPTAEHHFPNRTEYWDNLDQSIQAIKSLNDTLSNSGKDALLGYSYIYDLASDLELYQDQNQTLILIEHHWNHHILPQLADILFSNQIAETKLTSLLEVVNNDTHGFTIENTSTNTENSFERPSLKLSVGE
jgi:MoxR-like ATPase